MSPFDAARYARLLEGLDAGVAKSHAVLQGLHRLEAKYHTSNSGLTCQYFLGEEILDSANYNSVYGLNSEGIGCPVLRMNEFDMLFTGTPKQHSDKFSLADIRLHSLKKDDVLICRTNGNPNLIGKSALAARDYDFVYESHLFKVRPKQELINSATLVAYLNTRYGRAEIDKLSMQGNQANFSISKFKELRIPKFGSSLSKRIEEILYQCFSTLEDSKNHHLQAEDLLLEVLGLKNWQSPEPLSYIRRSNEAFASGRLDAQHFQPRFQALTDFIDATGQGVRLADWLSENQRGRQPDYAESGLPVVNSKHVLRGEVRLDADNRNARFRKDDLLIQQGDVLMNGTGVGTIGRCAPYLHEETAIPDNHVTVLRLKEGLDAVYLSIFLNSVAGQWQVEQRLRGSSGQIELYPNDIGQFRVWVAPAAVQAKIRKSVEMSHEQRQRATQLLEAAKRAVEIAIEDSEAAALAYLDQVAPHAH